MYSILKEKKSLGEGKKETGIPKSHPQIVQMQVKSRKKKVSDCKRKFIDLKIHCFGTGNVF